MSMDREIPAEQLRKRRGLLAIKTAAALAAVLFCGYLLRCWIAPSVSRERLITSIAEQGNIEASLSASGVVVPEYEQVITSPVRSTVEAVLLNSGEVVTSGQSIVKLDTEAAEFRVEQLQDELSFLHNQKRQLILELERQTIDLEASRDIKQLEVRFAETQLETAHYLHELGGATGDALAHSELNLDITRRQFEQLEKSIDNQKASLQAEIVGLDLRIKMAQSDVQEAQRDLALACAQAERDGVVTWVNDDIGSHVAAGATVARVADLSSYKIEAQISDIHAARLQAGGPVVVRIGDHRLKGSISAVRPSVEGGIARFDVVLAERSHEALRPNLRGDVFVITSYKENVLRVDNGPFFKGRVDQPVFVLDGDKAIQHTVDIGVSNYDYVEIIGDINPGDEVIVSDMSKYHHADVVSLTK